MAEEAELADILQTEWHVFLFAPDIAAALAPAPAPAPTPAAVPAPAPGPIL